MYRTLYTIFGVLVLGTFAYAQLRGLEFRAAKHSRTQQDLRHTTSGHRSFWYSGFHGGK